MERQMVFAAVGESMNNGIYAQAIMNGSAVIGEEISPDRWRTAFKSANHYACDRSCKWHVYNKRQRTKRQSTHNAAI